MSVDAPMERAKVRRAETWFLVIMCFFMALVAIVDPGIGATGWFLLALVTSERL